MAKGSISGVHLWLILWKACHAVEAHARRSIASLGLNYSDFAVLEALLHKGPLPVNVIGAKVLLTSGSITTAVDRLETRGLVERRSNSEDRRARIVHLTAAGRKLIRSAFAKHARALEQTASPVTPAERAKLAELLKKLGKHADVLPIRK